MTIKAKKSKINLREKLAELLNFRQIRDRLDGLGLYLGKDRTGTAENLAVRGGANVDDLQLAEISAALGGTAVDVFVYDTRNDSDGGKWRERTSHTSWYNEELNTATRGGRREFPAVAVIVAESGNVKKLKIYDGDDPDLPLWMSFEANGIGSALGRSSSTIFGISSVYMLNGLLCVTGLGSSGGNIETLCQISFIDDVFWQWHKYGFGDAGISERNEAHPVSTSEYRGRTDEPINVHSYNDVAMTVLPNAPIDDNTGLPIPTIAVATNGGVSVIKDDGSVVDITCSNVNFKYSYYVVFDQLNRLFFSLDAQGNKRRIWGLNNIPAADLIITTDINEKQNGDIFIADNNGFGTATKDMFLFNQSNPHAIGLTSDNSIGADRGLFKSFINQEDSSKSLYNYTTSSYNTGWMPGDTKLAALSDTKNETVGVDETTELVTNGGFDADSDWTKEAGWSISGGTAAALNATGNIYQIIDGLTIGQTYKISINVLAVTSGSVSYRAASQSQGGSLDIYSFATETGIREIVFKADTTSMLIGVYGSEFSGTIDSASLKQTGELVTNGTFDTDSDWTNSTSGGGGATGWTIASGVATSSGSAGYMIQAKGAVGTMITITYEVTSYTSGDLFCVFGSGGPGLLIQGSTSLGTHSITGIVTDNSDIGFYSLGTLSIDNVSVRLAEPDRSVNNNGLQIFGEITKSPVAPGADLVAYSGFSVDNYLMQPYNSDLDFGTGDFCVMGWFKSNTTNGGNQPLFWRGQTDNNSYAIIEPYITLDGKINVLTRDASENAIYFTSTSYILTETWRFWCMTRRSGVMEFYIDGEFEGSIVNGLNVTPSSANKGILQVGLDVTGTKAIPGSTALFRISATAPTAEQIAKIYRDEKALFTDGAQATLYGTSDAVTALAYDDKTELLHVGTSSGRSDFAGLRRINNTTTAVTTSISASNNLIAEQ